MIVGSGDDGVPGGVSPVPAHGMGAFGFPLSFGQACDLPPEHIIYMERDRRRKPPRKPDIFTRTGDYTGK